MTQTERALELPQISLQRYLDLLRRRRWQVIPVSLLGLVVGGLVALAIPRYFVATTVISYSRAPGEKVGSAEDPMADLVEVAQLTMPLAVADTLKALGWRPYAGLDDFAAQELEREVAGRVQIVDRNPGKTRSYAQLLITYRDRDGARSAEFLNLLIETWASRQLQDMRDKTAEALALANLRAEAAARAFETVSEDLRNLQLQYGIAAELTPQEQAVLRQDGERQRAALAKEQIDRAAQRQVLVAELERLRAELERTPRTLKAALPIGPQAAPGSEAARLAARLLYAQESLERMNPGHPEKRLRETEVQTLTRKLRELHGLKGEGAEVPNPAWQALRSEIAAKEAEQQGIEVALEHVTAAIEAANERQRQMVLGHYQYRNLQARLQEASENRQSAQREVERRTAMLVQLSNERPIAVVKKALQPPRPTEPNVVIIALIGCLLGLGVAIGLILGLDLLQGTYKTVDDVERGLPVPVLGGMAHMESEQRRQRVQRHRRRTSMAVGAIVFLALAVVTIYYVDPTRLPPLARDLLSLVLGE